MFAAIKHAEPADLIVRVHFSSKCLHCGKPGKLIVKLGALKHNMQCEISEGASVRAQRGEKYSLSIKTKSESVSCRLDSEFSQSWCAVIHLYSD